MISVSATGQLEGEINKIQIRRKALQQRKINESAAASQKISLNAGHQSAAQIKQTNKIKSGPANTLFWWGAGLMVIAFGVFFLKYGKM